MKYIISSEIILDKATYLRIFYLFEQHVLWERYHERDLYRDIVSNDFFNWRISVKILSEVRSSLERCLFWDELKWDLAKIPSPFFNLGRSRSRIPIDFSIEIYPPGEKSWARYLGRASILSNCRDFRCTVSVSFKTSGEVFWDISYTTSPEFWTRLYR